ncbi:cytosol aminopeptidase-like [Cimex lectularius]|uniref:Cytosol aminopeptidase n=1 Tax=Cimex lectularius TaxID=79782 RepID=A0A8I6SHQ3_CIMLE|nr:cytosol aminopeptidase-like [Cimex lectularius]
MFQKRTLRVLINQSIRRHYHPVGCGDCSYEEQLCEGKRGLVLGAYNTCEEGKYELTKYGKVFDAKVEGRISALLNNSGIDLGNARVFNGLDEFYGVAVAGLGHKEAGMNSKECLNECKENIRIASAVGARALQKQTIENIMVEGFTNEEAAAEGAILGLWRFQEFRNEEERDVRPKVALYGEGACADNWSRGVVKARAQNLARRLSDLPANILTPREFVKAALYYLCPCGVNVQVRDYKWILKNGMNAFFNMAKGSCSHPYFLELSYCGGGENDKPVVLVGKGTTYNSGGICLKECERMSEMRGDCAGASTIIGTMKAAAQFSYPMNIVGLIPLFENMPSGNAVKPGDIVLALSDQTIMVENTDNEGRVALADALVYANKFSPCLTVSIATLTKSIRSALGSGASGAYSTDDTIYEELRSAGADTGDRAVRLPLWDHYDRRNKYHIGVDMHNVGYMGEVKDGETALGAAFLNEFAPKCAEFLHLDITGVGLLTTGKVIPYYREGYMTGRPTRTVIQFLKQLSTPTDTNNTTKC